MPSVPKCGRIYTHKFTPDLCPLPTPPPAAINLRPHVAAGAGGVDPEALGVRPR